MMIVFPIRAETKLVDLEVWEKYLSPEQYKTIFDSVGVDWLIVKVGKKVEIFEEER